MAQASFQKRRRPRAYKNIKKEIYLRCFPAILCAFQEQLFSNICKKFLDKLFFDTLEQLRLDTVLSIRCSPKTLTKFIEKHLFRSLVFNKVAGQRSALDINFLQSHEFFETFKNTFLIE